MDAAKKDSLIADIDNYLSDQCRNFYQARGIPYRRRYLLYGPSGTGKTSFAVGAAGHFSIPLYAFNMSDDKLSDTDLGHLVSSLPTRCIILLEDIDCMCLTRDNVRAAETPSLGSKLALAKVTLSGLLKCIDGPTLVDGRIVFMTSNSPDSLDPALVRPGRCDLKILFGYVSAEVNYKFFIHMYTKAPRELRKGETSVSDVHDVVALAKTFSSKVPTSASITPAEVQVYLLLHRLDPVAAVEGASAWAQGIIGTKARGANVAAFANEVNNQEVSNEAVSTRASSSSEFRQKSRGSDSGSDSDSDDDEASSVSSPPASTTELGNECSTKEETDGSDEFPFGGLDGGSLHV